MSKKKIEEKVLGPDDMFYPGDGAEILRLAKVVTANQKDIDSIYHLYKKYIKANAPYPNLTCNCPTSVSSYYQKLLEWYSKNWK